MKLSVSIIFALIGAIAAETCSNGYFATAAGEPCNFACSDGCKDNACSAIGGACTDTTGCNEGWKDAVKGSGKCDSPICFGDAGCSEGGTCIAKNHCICGKSGAQVVAKNMVGDDGKFAGVDCVSLRKDGIMGAGVALIVMTVAISICGGIAEKNGKAK